MMKRDVSRLISQIAACIAAAREQGYKGSDDDYDLTDEDLCFIVSQLGRKPTHFEWLDVGLPFVGSAYIAPEEV